MKLGDIIDAVSEDLATVQAGVTSKVGARFVTSNIELVPRLVWVPVGETFGPAVNVSSNPRQLFTRSARLLVHVQGGDPERTGDLGPTELLVHRLIAALYRVCHGYVSIGSGQWPTEDGSTATSSPLYLLEVTLDIPVTDEVVESITLETIWEKTVIALAGGDETDIDYP